jgi:hypothetical protein
LKECSLRKKDWYEKYRKKSYIFLFKFFDNDFYNLLIYLGIICFVFLCLMI